MTLRGRGGGALVRLVVATVAVATWPAAAFGHAALLRTDPSASAILTAPPAQIAMTYSEPIAVRFAIVSVTDADGHQVTSGVLRHGSSAAQMLAPLRVVPAGWYLVYWRVISADGHPVRGAFTFAVGPNQGPAPQFRIPSLSETAATPQLVAARFAALVALMLAVGLVVFRLVIARPLVRRVPGSSLHALDVAVGCALAVALIAVPVYAILSTAEFAVRSALDVGDLLPLVGESGFGRGVERLELALALFALATTAALGVDRPSRPQRSIAELGAGLGTALAGGAALVVPGLAGHPAQTSPAALALVLDAAHLLAGSLWLGGLVGLSVLAWRSPAGARIARLSAVVPRFSRVALASVILLVGTGTGAALLHLPTLRSLWETSYGKALLVKIVLLALTMPLAGLNLARTRPRLESAGAPPAVRTGAVRALRGLVAAEALLVAAIVVFAATLTSLPPPPKAIASTAGAAARVGPGRVAQRVVRHESYRLAIGIDPNQAAVPNAFSVRITQNGKPVTGADVTLRFTMLDMEMGQLSYRLDEASPGLYRRSEPALVMVGHWGLDYQVAPRGAAAFDVLVLNKAAG